MSLLLTWYEQRQKTILIKLEKSYIFHLPPPTHVWLLQEPVMLNLSWYLWCQNDTASGMWLRYSCLRISSSPTLLARRAVAGCEGAVHHQPVQGGAARAAWRQANWRVTFMTGSEQGSLCPKAAVWDTHEGQGQFEALTRAVRERGAQAHSDDCSSLPG